MNNNNARCSVVFGVAVIAVMACGSGAVAQDAVSSIADAPVELDIQAQPIGDALNALAQQSGLQVVFFSEVAGDLQAREAVGEFESSEAALEYLLADTGLGYRFVNERTVAIRGPSAVVADDQGGASDSKNLVPAPVLMAQNQTSQAQTTVSSRSEEGGTGIVTGKVTDARTGANLKGAKVTIEETGQWTSTNDLGEFRLVNVPTGPATLTVSYLGYAGQTTGIAVHGDGTSQNFTLRGGNEIEEIVVLGQRSARAIALNLERTAENASTVLSSDFLGNFDGRTISESLRRAPGIAFTPNNLGEGTNIIVRGLEPNLNQITLNGLRIPEGTGLGRAPELSNILTDSISTITVHKTLLPNHDSMGTGGLVEVETRSPLDRDRRFLSFTIESGRSGGDFLDELFLSSTASGRFGDSENVGLSASIQYRERDFQTLSYGAFPSYGQYQPLDANGDPTIFSIFSVDPRLTFPFESGVDEVYPFSTSNTYAQTDTSNIAATLSAQWQIADHTDLKLDYQRSERKQDFFRRAFSLFLLEIYEPLPIDELGGEIRNALVWEDSVAFFGLPGPRVNPSHTYFVSRDETDETSILSFRGESTAGQLQLNYGLGYARGEIRQPHRFDQLIFGTPDFGLVLIDRSMLLPEALENTVDGRIVSPFAPSAGDNQYLLPLFNQAGFDLLNDPSIYGVGNPTYLGSAGENERLTAELSGRLEFQNSHIKYLEAGLMYEDAEFQDFQLYSVSYGANPGATLSDFGLSFDESPLADIGVDGGFNVISFADVNRFQRLANLESLSQGPTALLTRSPRDINPLQFQEFTREVELATYVQGRIDIGGLEVIGGVRVTTVDVDARNLSAPILFDENGVPDDEFRIQNTSLRSQSASETDVLPRVLMNYRFEDNMILRGGYYRSVARPAIQQLSSTPFVTLFLQPNRGPLGNQPELDVSIGNPDLKPATTDNYDVAFEYYGDNVSTVKVSAFYKRIKNSLELNSRSGFNVLEEFGAVLPDDPRFSLENLEAINVFVNGSIPQNSPDDAKLWGIELAVEQQLSFLPGAWDGLGVYANYTYTDSSKTEVLSGFVDGESQDFRIPDVRFNEQPDHQGTFAITYNRDNVDALLAYTSQSRYATAFARNNLLSYTEQYDTVDLRAEYRFDWAGGDYRVFLTASNLLAGTDEPAVEKAIGGEGGTPKFYFSSSYTGGRQYRLGISGTF